MRIVYLSGSVIPSRRANSIQVMRMCEAFAGNGHEVTLIGKTFEPAQMRDVYEYYGVRQNFELALIPVRWLKGAGILALPRVYACLRRYDPQKVLIYARDIYGVSVAVRMGFRVVYEAHAMPYNRLIRHLEASLWKNPNLVRIVAISQALRNGYAAEQDVAEKIIVSHDAAIVQRDSANADLSWPACRDTLQIGYTGHLYPGRGIDIVVECARRLPHYDFHIVGGSDSETARWRRRATANVCWHGFIEPAFVHHACARCDVLLMPYQKVIVNPHSHLNTVPWMSPMKLFEYMASRRAIIASDLPVLREVLNERTAVLVEPDAPDRWVDAIRKCDDHLFRQSLADNAYRTFLNQYTWEKRAETVLEGIEIWFN